MAVWLVIEEIFCRWFRWLYCWLEFKPGARTRSGARWFFSTVSETRRGVPISGQEKSFVYSVVCLFLQGRLTRGHTDFLFLVFFKKITRKENSIYLVELWQWWWLIVFFLYILKLFKKKFKIYVNSIYIPLLNTLASFLL